MSSDLFFKGFILNDFLEPLNAFLAMPYLGLGALFIISLLAATLLPMGSEPALLGYLLLQPAMFWPALIVATLGNSLGGVITFWMGTGAHRVMSRLREGSGAPEVDAHAAASAPQSNRWSRHATGLTQRYGPPVLLLSWLPLIGDPLCAVAGWMQLPFWRCAFFITLGKFARYAIITGLILPMMPAM